MKPIGRKNYGSIPHLHNSKLGEGDYYIGEGQERILTLKARDKHDNILVFEKYDGSNVGVAKYKKKMEIKGKYFIEQKIVATNLTDCRNLLKQAESNGYTSNGLIQNNDDGIYWAFAVKNEGLMDKDTTMAGK